MCRLLFNLHLYAASIAGAFIVVLGVTGGIMAFEPEIDRLLHWKLWHAMPQGRALSLNETGAAVAQALPAERVSGITCPSLRESVHRRGARRAERGHGFLGYQPVQTVDSRWWGRRFCLPS